MAVLGWNNDIELSGEGKGLSLCCRGLASPPTISITGQWVCWFTVFRDVKTWDNEESRVNLFSMKDQFLKRYRDYEIKT